MGLRHQGRPLAATRKNANRERIKWIKPGKALDIGMGERRNALFLLRRFYLALSERKAAKNAALQTLLRC
jgi:hypothetical protein